MKELAKVNNMYKKFGSSSKAILELEIDKDMFYELDKLGKNTDKLFVELNSNYKEEEEEETPLFKELIPLMRKICAVLDVNKSNFYKDMVKKYGTYKEITIERQSAYTLAKIMEKEPSLTFPEIVEDNGLNFVKLRIYKGINVYSTEELSKICTFIGKKCKELDIETSPLMAFYAEME